MRLGKLQSFNLGWPMRCLEAKNACRLQAERAPFIQMSQFRSCEVGHLSKPCPFLAAAERPSAAELHTHQRQVLFFRTWCD